MCVSSKRLNRTMVGYLLHLFTKWPRHMFLESIFSPRQKEVGSSAVTWNGNGEITYEYSILLYAKNAINSTMTLHLLHLYEEFTHNVNK